MVYAAVVGIGLLAGLIGGLFGVGGGIVIVPLLVLAIGVAPKIAIGTSLAVIVPTAIMAAFRHHGLGNIDWKVAGIMALGSVIGAFAGASLTAYLSGDALRKGFAIFLLATSVRMLLK